MMTKKLFDDNQYIKEATATVLTCKKCDEFYRVTLDATIFYPRGGGQQADRGSVGVAACVDVFEEGGEIIHTVGEPLKVGDVVPLVLDWEYRYDNMKQHLGQHIFSRAAEDMYKIATVSARIEDTSAHVELAKPLSYGQMIELTDAVNKIIAENKKVRCGYFTKAQAEDMGMPSKAFKHDNIRIVDIENFDQNPCGGTHPSTTGEVGLCTITGVKSVRGVFRVYYKFGERAVKNIHEQSLTLWHAQELLGCEDKDTLVVEMTKLMEKCERATTDVAQLKEQLRVAECENMLANATEIGETYVVKCHMQGRLNIKAAIDLLVLENRAVVLVTNHIGDMLNIVMAQSKGASDVDLGAPVKLFLAANNARGGGSKVSAQGMVDYSDEALKQADEMFLKIISEIA